MGRVVSFCGGLRVLGIGEEHAVCRASRKLDASLMRSREHTPEATETLMSP